MQIALADDERLFLDHRSDLLAKPREFKVVL